MNRWYGSLVALIAVGALGAVAYAQTAIKPAIVYANGGKFDKSFNEGVSNGAKKFSEETKVPVVDFEPANETQFEQAQRRFAQRGQDPIIADGDDGILAALREAPLRLLDGDDAIRAGAAAPRATRPGSHHRRRLLAGGAAGEGRQGVPQHPFHHHRQRR